MKRDLISVADIAYDLDDIIDLSISLKRNRYEPADGVKNRVLGMIFEKPSTRTRVSFEVAMRQLGGHSIYLNPADMQLGRGETISDTGRVLSGFVDAIAYRAFKHDNVLKLAEGSRVPVINALDDMEHPVQIIADFMTMREVFGDLEGRKLAYVGDGNNVANSLILGAASLGVDISLGCPKGYTPKKEIVDLGKELAGDTGSTIDIVEDPKKAVQDADAVYTDVWVSMGEESEKEKKEKIFSKYQVNAQLMDSASKHAIFLHCLPAHRGLEVTDEVIDGIRSHVFQQAENRLHTEKAVLLYLIQN
ncbi:MAG: ornithine carbamoyltransferase [Candidatus Thermoplasmatota archaeon]|jgi:ornithine carbamoyltransferase|nr:ornithine carbamoyltransferase [Candidatus Thermoplasmatota archaeon]MCL5800752.1 ornithine carbamoyltransferase [Candidatus Thermoplasmatota archaeon]